jgi:hypothetical protein
MTLRQTVCCPIEMVRRALRTSAFLFSVGAAIALFGCATPYQAKGFSGGYASFETQPGVYYVSFQGNGYTARETVIRYWHTRAADVCGGNDRYEIVQHGASTTQHIQGDASGIVTFNKHRAEGYIRCRGR